MRVRLLWYNTFLLGGVRLGPGSGMALAAKPELAARSRELPQRLCERLGPGEQDAAVLALCEVFGALAYGELARGLGQSALDWTLVRGPRDGTAPLGERPGWLEGAQRWGLPLDSGLVVAAAGMPVTRTATEVFGAQMPWAEARRLRGEPHRDPDFWANKGVMMCELDAGWGRLELFTTHVFAGGVGPLLPAPASALGIGGGRRAGPRGRQLAVKRAQLAQMVSFVTRHHRPEHVAVVAGDFNLDSAHAEDRLALQEALKALGAAGIALEDPFAHSARPTTLSPFAPRRPWQRGWAMRQEERLDYIFVQEPAASHALRAQVMARAHEPFARPDAGPGQMAHLSDHVALEVVLSLGPCSASRPGGRPKP